MSSLSRELVFFGASVAGERVEYNVTPGQRLERTGRQDGLHLRDDNVCTSDSRVADALPVGRVGETTRYVQRGAVPCVGALPQNVK